MSNGFLVRERDAARLLPEAGRRRRSKLVVSE
jgi:hypothetical protein